MKIACHCGHTIHDHTDGMPHKAHLIPDRRWNPLLDALEPLVSGDHGSSGGKEAALMAMHRLLSGAATSVWQCHACGRLYFDAGGSGLHCFVPAGEGKPRGITGG